MELDRHIDYVIGIQLDFRSRYIHSTKTFDASVSLLFKHRYGINLPHTEYSISLDYDVLGSKCLLQSLQMDGEDEIRDFYTRIYSARPFQCKRGCWQEDLAAVKERLRLLIRRENQGGDR